MLKGVNCNRRTTHIGSARFENDLETSAQPQQMVSQELR